MQSNAEAGTTGHSLLRTSQEEAEVDRAARMSAISLLI